MTDQKLSSFAAKRIEAYLHYRLTGQNKPEEITDDEEAIANRFYNEAIVRFFVGYSNFSSEEVLRAGLSKMLNYSEFRDGSKLAESLALFENATSLRHLLRDSSSHKELKFWIGKDLIPFGAKATNIAILTMPYFINQQVVGAFGILCPIRTPYRKLFGILRAVSQALSAALTTNLYKYKLTYRQPEKNQFLIQNHQTIQMIENKKGI